MPWYFILKRQLETTNSNILPPSVLMMHICFQGDFGYIIVLLKNLLVLLVPLKHIIAKKETPRQVKSHKSFLLWSNETSGTFQFLLT